MLPRPCPAFCTASAVRAATCGEAALVPPTTCQPTRSTDGKNDWYTSTPPFTDAFHARSGTRRWLPALGRTPCCQDGRAYRTLGPPPVAAGSHDSSQTTFSGVAPAVVCQYGALKLPSALNGTSLCGFHRQPYCSCVPPTAVTYGLDAGQPSVGKP